MHIEEILKTFELKIKVKQEAIESYKNARLAYQNRDYQKAFKEFTELANSGNKKAQNYLGVMYENGYGVSRDFDVAIRWYQKAINQGFTGAKYNLKTF